MQRPCGHETAVFEDRREVSEEPEGRAHGEGEAGAVQVAGGPTLPCAPPPTPRLPWEPRACSGLLRGPHGGAEGRGG